MLPFFNFNMYTYIVKKILVIGCNSFSGSSLIDFLPKKKFKIYGISRKSYKNKFNRFFKNSKKIEFRGYNLSNEMSKIIKYIEKIKPHFIVNYVSESMVAESWQYPEDWYKLNSFILPTFYHFLSKYKFIKKIIHFSTPEVYGSTKKNTQETNFFKPSTPYGVSRVTADQTCNLLFEYKKFPVIITRASNVYGEYQKLYRIIPKTIYSILNKKKIYLHGGGKSKRNFIHIDDVSNAILLLLKKGKIGNTYHISSDNMISIKSLIKIIGKKFNRNINQISKVSPERIGKDKIYSLNSNKLKKLGWKPKISLDQGLNKVIRWIIKEEINLKEKDTIYVHNK